MTTSRILRNNKFRWLLGLCSVTAFLVAGACAGGKTYSKTLDGVSVVYGPNLGVHIQSREVVLKLSPSQTLSVAMLSQGVETTLESPLSSTETNPSDYVTANGKDITRFETDYSKISIRNVQTHLGNCVRVQIPSRADAGHTEIEKLMSVDFCSAFPESAIFAATYTNDSNTPLKIDRVVQLAQMLRFPSSQPGSLWTFQGAGVRWGRDFIFPVPSTFHAENPEGQMVGVPQRVTFQGITHYVTSGEGGGIPVIDFWSKNTGLAIGHIESDVAKCWMPVETLPGGQIKISIETRPEKILDPKATLKTLHTFITVHHGDFYNALSTYTAMLRAEGVSFFNAAPDVYEPFWWTYGYGHNYRPAQVYQTLPLLKKLGTKWIMLNNRWWDRYGDWMPREDKFGGVAGFKDFIARLHKEGFKVMVWWMPVAVQLHQFWRSGIYANPAGAPKPSPYEEKIDFSTARIAEQHPDWLIENKEGNPVHISRNLAALCPAYPPARDYIVQLAKRMIENWKVDGLYLDVSYMVPSCYNPAHHHSSPYDSEKGFVALFRDIRNVVEQANPNAEIQICACGTTMPFCLLSDTNQPVTADPVGPRQVRWRIKMYKALLGPHAAVSADRVESTYISGDDELGSDFASGMGTGGVIGTMSNWPRLNMEPGDLEYKGQLQRARALLLTPKKVAYWEKWFDLYRQKMLSDGEFLNLYTIGFDHPEGYAIRKGRDIYYAFFVSQPRAWGIDRPPVLPKPKDVTWEGRLTLRGLDQSKTYTIIDYEHEKTLGRISGSSPYLKAKFVNHLLVEAIPAS